MVTKAIETDLDFKGAKIINAKQDNLRPSISTVTGATTLSANHCTVFLNAATPSTNALFTLPDPTTCEGRIHYLIARRGTITLTVTGGSQVLEGITAISFIPYTRRIGLVSDGTNWRTLLQFLEFNPTFESGPIFSDLVEWPAAGVVSAQAGTSAGVSMGAVSQTNRVGVANCGTGSTATGRCHISLANTNAVVAGGGALTFATAINLTNLSTATERFTFLIGFCDVLNAPNQTDGIYFLYDEGGVSTGGTASPNWQIVTSNANTRTFLTTTVPVAISTWTNFRIEVNAAGTFVEYFIDGTSVGTRTTNIPTGVGRSAGCGVNIIKSIGTTPVGYACDWLYFKANFATAPRGLW